MNWLKKTSFPLLWIYLSFGIIGFLYFPFILDAALWSKFSGISFLFFVGAVYYNGNEISLKLFKPKVFIFLLSFLLFTLFSVLFSNNRAEAFSFFAKYLLYFLFFVLSYLFFLKGSYKLNLSRAASILVFISSVFGFFQLNEFSVLNEYHQNSYLVTSFYTNRNLFVEVLVLCLGFVSFGFIYDSKYWRLLHFFSMFFIIAGSIFLMVRSAWIALFVFVLIFMIIMISSGLMKNILRKTTKISIVVVLLIIMSFLLIIKAFPDVKQAFYKQTYWFKNPDFGSSKERIELWKTCFPMTKENPILGVGPGNWKFEYPKYQTGEVREVKGNTYTQFQRVHNDFLQILSENGILAFISLLIIFVLATFYSKHIFCKSEDKSQKKWIALMMATIGAYGVFSFFSFPIERTEESILLAFVMASIVAEYHKTRMNNAIETFYRNKFLKLGFIIASGFCLMVGLYRMRGEYYTLKLHQERDVNKHISVIDYGEKAKNAFYQIDPVGVPIAFYQGAASFTTGDLPSALRYYKESYKLFPFHKQTLNDLASCYIVNNQISEGIEFYNKAITIAPKYEEALVNLSIVYFNKGLIDSSYKYISACDTMCKQPNYHIVVNALNKSILQVLKQKADSFPLISKKIDDISCNQNWQWAIFKHALESHQNLENRYIIEVLYSLETIDKKISKAESQQIKLQLMQ